jgi:Mn2+/Fe2+ NRAMP family transporter
VDERTLRRLETLVRALFIAAALVILLALVAGISVASSESSVPGVDEVQRENRGPIAVGVFAAGIAGAGILAGIGGIL